MLENAGGFFDEAAPIFGRRLQNGIETSLPDDHVHLTTEAGIAEQLLQIQEPAAVAVDGVLARSVAEEGSADRHLGVLDRERTVAVVDRQLNLGTTQRAARRRAREDDVLHLAAAEGLRALLPITQARASTTFDLPEPFGPTMHVTPGSKTKLVGCANDLKPLRVRLFRCIGAPIVRGESRPYVTGNAGFGRETAREAPETDTRDTP